MEPRIERLNPPQLHRPPGYHHVTVVGAGPMAYLAGQCPIDVHGELVGAGDLDAQVDQVVSNALAALGAVGAVPGDVVRSVIYVVSDAPDGLPQVWRRLLGSALAPAFGSASTLLGVARLGFAEQLVEVDLTAALPAPPVGADPEDGGHDDDAVTFRTATPSDVPAVLAFWQESAEDLHRPPDSRDALVRLLARDPDALILAEFGGQLVGSVIAGWDGWRCHLYRLAVAPRLRRRGVARALLARAEERFRTSGGIRADAMVLQDNEIAHHAWLAGGYRPQPEWARWVKPLTSDG